MSQAIKYQQTTIPAEKSAAQIQALVAKYGGTRCEVKWDEKGNVTSVRFAIRHERFGEVPIRLVAKTETIFKILQETRYNAWNHFEVVD